MVRVGVDVDVGHDTLLRHGIELLIGVHCYRPDTTSILGEEDLTLTILEVHEVVTDTSCEGYSLLIDQP